MTRRLDRKVALVTGAGLGIGRGVALRLAAEGARVTVVDLQQGNGKETVSTIVQNGGQAAFFQIDVRVESQCRAAIDQTLDQYGRLDVLVNNAGVYPRATLEQTTEAFWDQMMAVNLKGPFFLCKHSVPVMRRQGVGASLMRVPFTV